MRVLGEYMEKYEKEAFLKKEIIGQSRHLFIYGYQNEDRKQFVKELEEENPIQVDSNQPMAIRLEDYAFKKESYDKSTLDDNKIQLIGNNYLHFCIGHRLVQKTIQDVDLGALQERIKKLLERINRYSQNKTHPKIETIRDLEEVLEESKRFYEKYYYAYIHREETPSIEDIYLPFILLESFVSDWKNVLNNDSYISVLVEKTKPIEIKSTRAVNFLVGGRINKDISMKIITDPNDWDSYRDQNGQVIEYIHDYGIVELDESNKQYLKK